MDPSLGDLRRVVEVQDGGVPVIGLVDEVQQDLHHGVKELAGQVLGLCPGAQGEDVFVILPRDVEILLLKELSC